MSLKDIIHAFLLMAIQVLSKGSGKSYSIHESKENPGIIPMVCNEMFTRIDKLKSNPAISCKYTVEIQMIEIYKENIHNLLANTEEEIKQIHEIKDAENKIIIEGLEKIVVNDYKEMKKLYEIGYHNRTSKRAHTIFTITLTIEEVVNII